MAVLISEEYLPRPIIFLMRRKIIVRCFFVTRCWYCGLEEEDFMDWFPVCLCWCFRLIANRVHLLDGRLWVKFIMRFEVSSRLNEEDSSGSAVLSRSSRVASRMYEALRTGEKYSGEEFQNMGTFIVVRSTVFSKSSAHKTHFARDAHDAFLRGAGRRQVQYFHWLIR